jgi:hypothetical protein
MTTQEIVQFDTLIKVCEYFLKSVYGYQPFDLEAIGLDCPTSKDYLDKLVSRIDAIEVVRLGKTVNLNKGLDYQEIDEPLKEIVD